MDYGRDCGEMIRPGLIIVDRQWLACLPDFSAQAFTRSNPVTDKFTECTTPDFLFHDGVLGQNKIDIAMRCTR